MRNPIPAALIFDMDGTLVDNMEFHTRAWLEILAELGVPTTAQALRSGPGGLTSLQLLEETLGDGLAGDERTGVVERKEALYRRLYRAHMRPLPGLISFLRAAHTAGVPLAVATSAGPANIRFVLEGLDVAGYFDVVVGAGDVPQGKTGPEMFLETAHRLAVEPEWCTVFEDSRAGIQAAAQAGMATVVVATDRDAERLGKLPSVVQVVKDYTEVEPAWFTGGRQASP